MARDLTVKARIVAEDDASATIGKVQGRFARLGSFLASRFVVTLGDVSQAFRLVGEAITFAFNEAAENEQSARRLEASLARFGPLADETARALNAQAKALAQSTTATGNQVTAMQTLLANLGTAPSQIEQATEASLNLAAAFGLDLEQAARAVGLSLQGSVGAIGKLVPELKDLDEAALRAGKGLELLEQRFGGRAAAEVNTLTGAVGELQQAFADLAGEIAAPVNQSGVLRTVVQTLTAALQAAAGSFTSVSDQAKAVAPAVAAAASNMLALTRGATSAALGLDTLTRAEERAARIALEAEQNQKGLIAALSAAGVTFRDFNLELERQETALEALRVAYRDGRVDGAEFNANAAQITANMARIREEMHAAASGTSEFNAAVLASTEASGALAASLAKAGVTLRDFDAELAANEQAMRALEATYKATGENAVGVALAMEQLREANARIREEARLAALGVTDFSGALTESGEAARVARTSYAALNSTLRQTDQVARTTARSLQQVALAAIRAGDLAGAIAAGARLSQGGTRIRLPGGGSRLNRTGQVN